MAATAKGLSRFQQGSWTDVSKGWSYPGDAAQQVYFGRDGTLWVATGQKLLSLPPRGSTFVDPGEPSFAPTSFHFAQAPDGEIWFVEDGQSAHTLRSQGSVPETVIRIGAGSILFDRDGSLWMGALGDGLLRVDAPQSLRGRQIDWFRIQEGRAALRSLRTSTIEGNELAEDFKRAGEECTFERPIEFAVAMKGSSRTMHPIVRDEVYRIGCEAIRNACLHSEASRVDVELDYQNDLIVRVQDDGKGMEPYVARSGKAGHFGVVGMYERAARVGGKLTITSSAEAGTLVELAIPRSLAFQQPGLEQSSHT